MTKPMTLETTEKLALLADALWSAFLNNATLDGADVQYMLEQSGLNGRWQRPRTRRLVSVTRASHCSS
jgi:hypothetical protein